MNKKLDHEFSPGKNNPRLCQVSLYTYSHRGLRYEYCTAPRHKHMTAEQLAELALEQTGENK